jgi:ABC-type Co2+ transport system permease subunit
MMALFPLRLKLKTWHKRIALVGVGVAAMFIVVVDMFYVVSSVGNSPYVGLMEPGIGMFLAIGISIALIVVTLMPRRGIDGAPRSRSDLEIRPGSPGSGL